MNYLLDTDVLSIWQRGTGPDFAVLQYRISEVAADAIGVAVATVHEQALGCHAFINRAKKQTELIRGYALMSQLVLAIKHFPVAPFDGAAAAVLDGLRTRKLGPGEMDLRIAAVALANNLTLVTRNVSDFGRIPGLRTEDWTR